MNAKYFVWNIRRLFVVLKLMIMGGNTFVFTLVLDDNWWTCFNRWNLTIDFTSSKFVTELNFAIIEFRFSPSSSGIPWIINSNGIATILPLAVFKVLNFSCNARKSKSKDWFYQSDIITERKFQCYYKSAMLQLI